MTYVLSMVVAGEKTTSQMMGGLLHGTFDRQVKNGSFEEKMIELNVNFAQIYSCNAFTEECGGSIEWATGKD